MAALASTLEAQEEFRGLYGRWSEPLPEDREALARALESFLAKHGRDPRARQARALLAWLRIESGTVREAAAHAAVALQGPSGSVRDFAVVVYAATLTRTGRPAPALAALAPLHGKLIGERERLIYHGEGLRAALGARRPVTAARYMVDLLEDLVDADDRAAHAELGALLEPLGSGDLGAMLAAVEADVAADPGAPAARVGARRWLLASLGKRLAQRALVGKDVALAQRLVDSAATRGDSAEHYHELTELAASGVVKPRVQGRTLGLVLDTGTAEGRARSAAVARGLTRALASAEQGSEPPRLITRDAAGGADSLQRALAELASDGAALLVAGIAEPSASVAAAFSASAGVPVLLLAEPGGQPSPAASVFVLGEAWSAASAVIDAALVGLGVGHAERVGDGAHGCDAPIDTATGTRFPVRQWRHDRLGAVVVLGNAACARELLREALGAGWTPSVALGPESAEAYDEVRPAPDVVAASGPFPGGLRGPAPAPVLAWKQRHAHWPSWYECLGHDAAELATRALGELPVPSSALEEPPSVEEPPEVGRLHALVARGLGAARGALWSTERVGFEGARRLSRHWVALRRTARTWTEAPTP